MSSSSAPPQVTQVKKVTAVNNSSGSNEYWTYLYSWCIFLTLRTLQWINDVVTHVSHFLWSIIFFTPHVSAHAVHRPTAFYKPGVLITDAVSTGLATAITLRLADLGFTVFAGVPPSAHEEGAHLVTTFQIQQTLKKTTVSDSSDATGGARRDSKKPSHLTATAGSIIPIVMDVAQSDTIQLAHTFVTQHLESNGVANGRLIAIIHTASLAARDIYTCAQVPTPLENVREDEFHQLLQTCVLATHVVTKTFTPLLREMQGRVISVSTVLPFSSGPQTLFSSGQASIGPVLMQGALATATTALDTLMQAARFELAPFGMSVSTVRTGFLSTRNTHYGKRGQSMSSSIPAATTTTHKNKLTDTLLESSVSPPASAKSPSANYQVMAGKVGQLCDSLSRWSSVCPLPAASPALTSAPAASQRLTDDVVSAVERALLSSHPLPEYDVGWDAILLPHLTRWIPSPIWDVAVSSYLKL